MKSSTADTWNLYSQVGSAAAVARTNLAFEGITWSGVLTSGGSQAMYLVIPGGAAAPQSVTVDFSDVSSSDLRPGVIDRTQNRFASGALDRISVDAQGRVVAQFSNGQTRALAQFVSIGPSIPMDWRRQAKICSLSRSHPVRPCRSPTTDGLGKVVSGAIDQPTWILGRSSWT